MEPQNVAVLNGVSDRIGMKLPLEQVVRRAHRSLGILDLLQRGVVIKNGCTSEAKELGARKKLFDGFVVLAKLRAVAFVEDEDDPFVL